MAHIDNDRLDSILRKEGNQYRAVVDGWLETNKTVVESRITEACIAAMKNSRKTRLLALWLPVAVTVAVLIAVIIVGPQQIKQYASTKQINQSTEQFEDEIIGLVTEDLEDGSYVDLEWL